MKAESNSECPTVSIHSSAASCALPTVANCPKFWSVHQKNNNVKLEKL